MRIANRKHLRVVATAIIGISLTPNSRTFCKGSIEDHENLSGYYDKKSQLFSYNNKNQATTRKTLKDTNAADLRLDYKLKGLIESDLPKTKDPHELFDLWFTEACESNIVEPNAMCISTCNNNKPSSRYVLLKAHDKNGYIFFTNYNSRKGKELLLNPYACLTFWWGDLERSIRIEGKIEKLSDDESDKYFHSRPRSSQIGAWTSNQSEKIHDRNQLEIQENSIIKQFDNVSVIPRPPHWGGYKLVPSDMEFWKGRTSRLHDRILFKLDNENNSWKIVRLQP
jgi:pyridoxamine 5'-phosphate oxidase